MQEESPENQARGVILALALAQYWASQGVEDKTMEYLKLAMKFDPDVEKYYLMLWGIKSKKDIYMKYMLQNNSGSMKRGILIGASGVAAIIGAWWGLSYLFADQHPSAGTP